MMKIISDPILTYCPNCQTEYDAITDEIGSYLECPECHRIANHRTRVALDEALKELDKYVRKP